MGTENSLLFLFYLLGDCVSEARCWYSPVDFQNVCIKWMCIFLLPCQVVFQGSSSGAIKDLADEIKMMENIKHPHLVHYYGVEKHQVSSMIVL